MTTDFRQLALDWSRPLIPPADPGAASLPRLRGQNARLLAALTTDRREWERRELEHATGSERIAARRVDVNAYLRRIGSPLWIPPGRETAEGACYYRLEECTA